jgi:Dyp-type peroxidase family
MSGLRRLDLEAETLASFPAEFQEGMKARADLLGDFADSAPDLWDEPWRNGDVHMLVTCYSSSSASLEQHCQSLRRRKPAGVHELTPHQDAGLLVVNGKPDRIEHFGFADGLSNPAVESVPDNGGPGDTGNIDEKGRFREVPMGEFLLGHRGEGGEVAPMPRPRLLVRNGTYLVLRKLEQDVVGFRRFLKQKAALVRQVLGSKLPAGVSAEDFLAAKMMGRWKDGSSLDLYPDAKAKDATNAFTYADDPEGARCPLGAHTRRANPRGSLGFGGDIISRRRVIRRGIAYGDYLPEEKETGPGANTRRGMMFVGFNASIERQFEFLQQQWLNSGDELLQGDDADPVVGSRYADGRMVVPGQQFRRDHKGATGRMMIPGDERKGRPPFLCCDIPNFVSTRGGGYFFVPSLTGLRLLASGTVNVS